MSKQSQLWNRGLKRPRAGEQRRAFLLLFLVVLLPPAPLFLSAEKPPVRYAESLRIEERGATTEVTVSNAWEGAAPLRYLLVDRDADVDLRPFSSEYDAVIHVPVERVASLATPAIAHLADLGELERVVAVDNGDYIYNRRVRQRISSGIVPEVGSGAGFNLERLLTAAPDLVILSVIGPDDPTVRRLESVGIPVLSLADWREQSPLGRAEWIRLFGALLGKEQAANRIFLPRVARYEELARFVATETDSDEPTVLTNAPWQGSWPVPAGQSYVARLLETAGGDYLWSERQGTGSLFLDLEAVLERGAEADVWINLNYGWTSRADAVETDPRLEAFRAYKRNNMYHHNRRVRESGANDFWESGATRPDLVLSDLIRILHPTLLPDHQLVYYRQLDP